MAYRDLTGGGRVGFCRRNACGKVFLARRADQEYCSPRCKATAKKRYQRHPEIAQEAIRLSKQGLSVAQIADVLLLSEKRVAAWIESDAREDERSTERDHQSGGQ
jgi:transposase-like protein